MVFMEKLEEKKNKHFFLKTMVTRLQFNFKKKKKKKVPHLNKYKSETQENSMGLPLLCSNNMKFQYININVFCLFHCFFFSFTRDLYVNCVA